MTVSLSKGQNVSLSKEAPDLNAIDVCLGWDARVTTGLAFDLDASAFLLYAGEKVRSDTDFIFYNNKISSEGAVVHQGDNTSGEGEGDDEIISITLSQIPADVQKIAFSVTIHEAETRQQTFGQVNNAYVRVVNKVDGREITRYDLSEDYSVETAMIFGELYRHGSQWKFKAIGQGFAGGLGPLAKNFGVNIG